MRLERSGRDGRWTSTASWLILGFDGHELLEKLSLATRGSFLLFQQGAELMELLCDLARR